MVKIRKGNLTAFVPLSTYKNHYEKLGWKTKSLKNKPNTKLDGIEAYDENQQQVDEEDIGEETPVCEVNLASMNLEQLKSFAVQNDIDISNASSKKEIRAIIQTALGEQYYE